MARNTRGTAEMKAVICDSREPDHIKRLNFGCPSMVQTLETGDLHIATDDDKLLIVERKAAMDFVNSIKNIATGDKRMEDFTFMEVFKAESIIENDEVINILKKNELLYPVSFVVRKQDTVLKNLINLRLLEMRSTLEENTKSELENLIKKIATSDAVQIPEEKFENIFIQSYQFEATT